MTIAVSPANASPRVHLTYTVEEDGDRTERELPFVIALLGDFAPGSAKPRPPFAQRTMITLSERNIDAVMDGLAPALVFDVPDHLADEDPTVAGSVRTVSLAFTCMADFEPEAVSAQIPELRALVSLRSALAIVKRRLWTGRAAGCADRQAAARMEKVVGALIASARQGTGPDGVGLPFQEVLDLAEQAGGERDAVAAVLDRWIVEMDLLIGRQVDAVLHAPEFQRLEATWRGVHYLVRQVPTGPLLSVKILPASREEVMEDLRNALVRRDGTVDLDRRLSTLYDILYTREYGQHGGEPIGLLVLDQEVTPAPEDLEALHLLSVIAADAHMPVLAGASARLLGLDGFPELGERPIDIAASMSAGTGAVQRWHAFRTRDTARYVGLVLPRVLARLPHRPDEARARSFPYREAVSVRGDLLWMSAAYPLAARVADAFARFGWCVAFTGLAGGGGVVDSLPVPDYGLGGRDRAAIPPVEVQLTEDQEQALVDAGLIPLMPAGEHAVFYSARSAQDPVAGTDGAALGRRISSRLPFIFAASRVAHYLKVMTRESIGRSQSRIEIESELNRWLSRYVTYQDDASMEARARRPLRDASVSLSEIEGEPGRYVAEVSLQPHYQIEELDFSLKLATFLQPGAG